MLIAEWAHCMHCVYQCKYYSNVEVEVEVEVETETEAEVHVCVHCTWLMASSVYTDTH